MLYDDGRVACDENDLIIRTYYIWGSAKKIPYASIRTVTRQPLTDGSGRWRIWGSSDFIHWWNLDPARPKKQVALIIDLGKSILPSITPDDPEQVGRILREKGVTVEF